MEELKTEWNSEEEIYDENLIDSFSRRNANIGTVLNIVDFDTEIDIFKAFFDEEISELIRSESEKYLKQKY